MGTETGFIHIWSFLLQMRIRLLCHPDHDSKDTKIDFGLLDDMVPEDSLISKDMNLGTTSREGGTRVPTGVRKTHNEKTKKDMAFSSDGGTRSQMDKTKSGDTQFDFKIDFDFELPGPETLRNRGEKPGNNQNKAQNLSEKLLKNTKSQPVFPGTQTPSNPTEDGEPSLEMQNDGKESFLMEVLALAKSEGSAPKKVTHFTTRNPTDQTSQNAMTPTTREELPHTRRGVEVSGLPPLATPAPSGVSPPPESPGLRERIQHLQSHPELKLPESVEPIPDPNATVNPTRGTGDTSLDSGSGQASTPGTRAGTRAGTQAGTRGKRLDSLTTKGVVAAPLLAENTSLASSPGAGSTARQESPPAYTPPMETVVPGKSSKSLYPEHAPKSITSFTKLSSGSDEVTGTKAPNELILTSTQNAFSPQKTTIDPLDRASLPGLDGARIDLGTEGTNSTGISGNSTRTERLLETSTRPLGKNQNQELATQELDTNSPQPPQESAFGDGFISLAENTSARFKAAPSTDVPTDPDDSVGAESGVTHSRFSFEIDTPESKKKHVSEEEAGLPQPLAPMGQNTGNTPLKAPESEFQYKVQAQEAGLAENKRKDLREIRKTENATQILVWVLVACAICFFAYDQWETLKDYLGLANKTEKSLETDLVQANTKQVVSKKNTVFEQEILNGPNGKVYQNIDLKLQVGDPLASLQAFRSKLAFDMASSEERRLANQFRARFFLGVSNLKRAWELLSMECTDVDELNYGTCFHAVRAAISLEKWDYARRILDKINEINELSDESKQLFRMLRVFLKGLEKPSLEGIKSSIDHYINVYSLGSEWHRQRTIWILKMLFAIDKESRQVIFVYLFDAGKSQIEGAVNSRELLRIPGQDPLFSAALRYFALESESEPLNLEEKKVNFDSEFFQAAEFFKLLNRVGLENRHSLLTTTGSLSQNQKFRELLSLVRLNLALEDRDFDSAWSILDGAQNTSSKLFEFEWACALARFMIETRSLENLDVLLSRLVRLQSKNPWITMDFGYWYIQSQIHRALKMDNSKTLEKLKSTAQNSREKANFYTESILSDSNQNLEATYQKITGALKSFPYHSKLENLAAEMAGRTGRDPSLFLATSRNVPVKLVRRSMEYPPLSETTLRMLIESL